MIDPAKRAEWRAAWPLPFVAMLGVAGSSTFTFSSGVFMGELTREFGWSRTDFTSATIMSLLISLVMIPTIGRLADRIGPRRIVLAGIVPSAMGTALLGLANGQVWQWWLLVAVQAVTVMIVVPPVWLAAVVSRFHASRGLAIGIALAGSGLGTAAWPVIAAFFVKRLGWRLAFVAMSASWAAIMLPLALLFFRGANDGPAAGVRRKAPEGYGRAILSRPFLCLAGAGGLMTLVCLGLMIHLVPILRAEQLSLKGAAGLAGLAGLFSILGRIATGLLLDVVASRPFVVAVFLLPLAVALLLMSAGGALPMLALAVILLGLAMGAENDILSYITSRRFDPALFGSLYSVIQTVLAVGSITGSIGAGLLFDVTGSYGMFLLAIVPLALLAALLVAAAGDPRSVTAGPHEAEIVDVNAGPLPLAMKGLGEER